MSACLRRLPSYFQSLGEYDYHYKLYAGSADMNYKFHDPELIADMVRKIKPTTP
jgi:hypothetical protein